MNTVLFDLDGTLLPMDLDEFIKNYFGLLKRHVEKEGYDGDRILHAVMAGTKQMLQNNGEHSNAEVFWKVFEEMSGYTEKELYDTFLYFYTHDFQTIADVCTQSLEMIEAVAILKEKGYRLLCATNPIFPSIASESRLKWSGVDTTAFDEITTFENYHYCKPNPKYYEEIIEKFNLDRNDILMVGNDAKEDVAIQELGIPVYLVNDHLIQREDDVITSEWISDAKGFLAFVKGLDKVS